MSIEKKTADAILQTPFKVKVGDREYEVAPPTAGTLIAVSGMLPRMPFIDEEGILVNETMAVAKDCKVMYEMLAMLILGHKRYRENRKVTVGEWWRRRRVSEYDLLVDSLMDECTNSETYKMVLDIIKRMQLRDFFALSVSLHEMRLIQQTRGTETTASGR